MTQRIRSHLSVSNFLDSPIVSDDIYFRWQSPASFHPGVFGGIA